MRRREWTDPAPLEVERPRLPWWTMLPRKLLYVLAPIITVAVVIRLLVFVARRLYRYPVAVIGAATLATLGVTVSWWASAGLLALLVMVVGVWRGGTGIPSTAPRCGRSVRSGAALGSTRGRGGG